MKFSLSFCFLAASLTFLLSAALTGILVFLSHRYGWYPPPPPGERWKKEPKPVWGGVAMFISFLLTLVLSLFWNVPTEWAFPLSFLLGCATVFGIGLWDDISPVSPPIKLAFQILAASLVLTFGLQINLWGTPWLDVPLVLFWIVGITNGLNLLDNMDGLAAGTAVISSFLLFVYSWQIWPPFSSLALLCLSAASFGFLLWNFYPAKIFMGDSGSLFLGFSLAVLSIQKVHTGTPEGLLPPLLVLILPILDTSLVVVMRWLYGRGIFQGGTDHLSHRLVALGLRERSAVLILYLIAALMGGILLFSKWIGHTLAWLLTGLSFPALLYFLMLVGDVPVYKEAKASLWKKRIQRYSYIGLLMIIDVFLLSVSFVSSYLIRFEGEIPRKFWEMIFQGLPVFLAIEIFVLYLSGVYYLSPVRFSLHHLRKIFVACTVGAVCLVLAATMIWRFIYYPRSVFFIHWLLSTILLSMGRSLIQLYCYLLKVSLPKKGALLGKGEILPLLWQEFSEEDKQEIQGWLVLGERREVPEGVEVYSLEKLPENLAFVVWVQSGLLEEEKVKIRSLLEKEGLTLISLRSFFRREM